jgi:hypothetical protein
MSKAAWIDVNHSAFDTILSSWCDGVVGKAASSVVSYVSSMGLKPTVTSKIVTGSYKGTSRRRCVEIAAAIPSDSPIVRWRTVSGRHEPYVDPSVMKSLMKACGR